MPQTVLVTGSTGYIAKHIVLQLLEAGYTVKGSARGTSREAELRTALEAHLSDPSVLERLSVVALDLTKDDGWNSAMEGVDVLMHTASPFPLTQPKDENETIRPAVDGAMRAVKAAHKAGVTRVIMTSSTVAIMNTDLPPGRTMYTEQDWSDLTGPLAIPYNKSKTLAEKAVWDWQKAEAPDMQITMINPTFVQGAPLDKNFGTSVEVVERLVKGTDPMLPNIGFPVVDVRDIALMHLRALERPESVGKRFIGVDRFMWFAEMAKLLKSQHPNRKIPTRVAPNFFIRFLSLFDASIKTILPQLGQKQDVSGAQARDILGIEFRDTTKSIEETGAFLIDNKLV